MNSKIQEVKNPDKLRVFFKTFGCRTNLFDTQVMRANLRDFVISEDEQSADVVVVNSCTVTNGADAGVRNYINRLSKSGKKIVFTGCGVKTQGKIFFEKSQIFGSFSHSHKEKINDLLLSSSRFFYEDEEGANHLDQTIVGDFDSRVRAFIKIQEGCDFACSYCIIPQVRGIARSYEEGKILDQIKILAACGVKEVVLTGTNVGSYGKERGGSVAKLIKNIAQISSIKRVRVGSLEPSQVDEEFLELLEDDLLEKHLHVALQHTHDRMLEIMNRKNRTQSDRILLEKIASKNCSIGTDFIIAHPGESEAVWKEAIEAVQTLPITHIHPFIYSPRSNTPSAKLKNDVRADVAKMRLHQLKAIIQQKNLAFRKAQSKMPLFVLIEKVEECCGFGLDQFFNKVVVQNAPEGKNTWLEVRDYTIQEEGSYARF